MEHVRALDGIRGVAVSIVVLYHFGIFPAGWIGVQIFFVLSGYLITGHCKEKKNDHSGIYLGHFYWRRALRIFPLYFFFRYRRRQPTRYLEYRTHSARIGPFS